VHTRFRMLDSDTLCDFRICFRPFSLSGEETFFEYRRFLRVSKIGHSRKLIFPECYTQGRIALGKEMFFRVPQCTRHSGKSDTRQRPSFPITTLGKEQHLGKKSVT
jgi:hypothetical protein